MYTDADLFAYLENNTSSATAAKIEASAELRTQADVLAAESRELTALFFRQTCPSADALGDYHFGFLSTAETGTISQHLAVCPHCTRELVQMQRFVGELPTESTLLERVKVWLADLLPTFEPEETARLAFRGDEDELILYEANGLQISIDVQDDVEHVGYRAIVGLVIGDDDEQTYQAQLYRAGDHVQTVEVDYAGSFILNHLPPGEYELILNGGDVLVHLQLLKV